jgi:hypothetical protein
MVYKQWFQNLRLLTPKTFILSVQGVNLKWYIQRGLFDGWTISVDAADKLRTYNSGNYNHRSLLCSPVWQRTNFEIFLRLLHLHTRINRVIWMSKLCMHVCMCVSQTFALNLLQFLSKYPCQIFNFIPPLLEFNHWPTCGHKRLIYFLGVSEHELKSCLT